MDLGIKGRKALVTGGDSGIGLATARLLLEEGTTVVITDLDQNKLDAATHQLPARNGQLHAIAADITDPESVMSLQRQVQDAVGDIDILVQSAGITGAQGDFHEIDDAGWMRTIETDLLGPVRLVRAFLPSLRKGGWGRVVFLASEDAEQTYPEEIPYCAAKAGILALSKGLSKTYASEGLLVNAVSPAFIATPMTDAMMEKRAGERGTDREEAIESFLREKRPGIELQRRGEADEVAAVVVFLCSDRASFVNGSNWRVDAGSVSTI
ncbi:MAG: SDR family oxidoreductase [Chloroflexota bacterium]|nr:SDR family oxidoreductase [Chloroflexota bacterium]